MTLSLGAFHAGTVRLACSFAWRKIRQDTRQYTGDNCGSGTQRDECVTLHFVQFRRLRYFIDVG